VAELMFFDIAGAAHEGYERGRRRRLLDQAERDRGNLNALASEAYRTPEEGQNELLSRMASIDPQAAATQNVQFQSDNERRLTRMKNMTTYMLNAVRSGNPAAAQGAWNVVRPGLQKDIPGGQYGEQWTPEYEEALHQVAAKLGIGGEQEQRNLAVSPGSAIVNPQTGDVIYERPFAPANAQVQEVPDGRGGTVQLVFDPRTRQWDRPAYPGQQAPAENRDAFDEFVAPILADAKAEGRPVTGQEFMELYRQYQANGPGGIAITDGRPNPSLLSGSAPTAPAGNAAAAPNPVGGALPPRYDYANGGLGTTPPERDTNQVRTLSATEVVERGLPPGTVAQEDGNGRITVVNRPEKEATQSDGLNDRQRVAVRGVQRNLLSYASALTGLSQEQLAGLTSQEIADEVVRRGGRTLQGATARGLSRLPGGGLATEIANADILSYSQGAGSAWASYENPTGMITNTDRESATAQMPNPLDPIDVQATKIKNFLELSGWGQGAAAPAQRAPQSPPAAAGGLRDVSDADLLRMLNGGQ
jgi:hypothetical protein